nr:hypothetical protein [Frankia sp. ArI3]
MRSAGSANSSPTTAVPATPTAIAASNGQPRAATSRPAISAAIPEKASWARESCPVNPTSTTTDRMINAHSALASRASTQSRGNSQTAASIAATATARARGWTRPLPSTGWRSAR